MRDSSQTLKLILKHLLTSLLPFSKACITLGTDSGSVSYLNKQPKTQRNPNPLNLSPRLNLPHKKLGGGGAEGKFGYLFKQDQAVLVGEVSLSFVSVFCMPLPKKPRCSDVYHLLPVYRVRFILALAWICSGRILCCWKEICCLMIKWQLSVMDNSIINLLS